MEQTEIWKDVSGFEGLYKISNFGRVMSLNYKRIGISQIRVPRTDKGGYLYVNLHKNNKTKSMKIHRLVASAFLPNPQGLPQINHIDEDKLNNCLWNLEWCNASYNNKYGTRTRKVLDSHKRNGSSKAEKPVVQMDKQGNTIAEFISISEAARQMGVSRESLRDAALGYSKTCKGFIWIHKNTK